MKRISIFWLITSMAIMPSMLNLNNPLVCFFILVNLFLSVRCARKHNPSMFIS